MNPHFPTLTRAIASGDTEAFARFYDQWFDRMYAEARHLTGRDEAFCLDVVHDAMLRVIRSMKPIDHEAALHAWLRRVVASCAYDRLRSDKRRRAREFAARNGSVHHRSDEVPDDRLVWLREHMRQLDAESAELLHLRYQLGWTLRAIGERLGMTISAVDRRLRSITNRLARRAREDFDE